VKAHSYTHKRAEDRPYVCTICSAGFLRPALLSEHLAAHKSFGQNVSQRVLPLHMRKPRHTCPTCDRRFFLRRHLFRHMIHHSLPPEKKRFPCSLCDRVFGNVEYLRSHMSVHSDARPFRCTDCSRTFRWRANLKAHIQRTHRPVQPAAEV
jgi:uncharacterized Zn-finger protein